MGIHFDGGDAMTGRLVLRRLAIAGACLVVILGWLASCGSPRSSARTRRRGRCAVSADRIAADVQAEKARASDLSGALTTLESQTTVSTTR
jgi:hypothetical protein